MDFLTLFLLAIGLTADAFAVSMTNGICRKKVTKRYAFANGIIFGFFQALMPMIGFILGNSFSEVVHLYQHWIALILLGGIGINMLIDAFKESKNPTIPMPMSQFLKIKTLFIQGIATSIDALATGVGFAVLDINIIVASLTIGLVTFCFCFVGVYFGRMFGVLLGVRAKFAGGIILILIGLKIFLESFI